MKKIIVAILTLTMILSLAACGGTESETTETSADQQSTAVAEDTQEEAAQETTEELNWNKSLNIGITADPKVLALSHASSGMNVGKQQISQFIWQYPVVLIPDLDTNESQIYYVLIKDYEKIDSQTYEIHIREGIHDIEGNPITAEDFKFSYQYNIDGGGSPQILMIDEMTVIDDYTLQYHFKDELNAGDIVDILSVSQIFSQDAFEAYVEETGDYEGFCVGTTGYKLVEYVSGSHVLIEKADVEYWNEAANESKSLDDGYCPQYDTTLDSITFQIITDTSTMALAIENGDVDLCMSAAIQDALIFQENSDFNVAVRPDNMYILAFNCNDACPTSSENLRKAIAYAVDAAGVLAGAYDGHGITLKAWAYPSYTDYQSSWDSEDYFEYDEDKAKEYLEAYYKESGTTASDLHIRLLLQNGTTNNKAAQSVQAYIAKLTGNDNAVELSAFDKGTFNTTLGTESDYDIALMSTQSISRSTCIYNWSYYYDTVKNTTELTHTFDSKLQSLLEAASKESTHSDETVAAFQEYLNEKCYLKALCSGDVYIVSASWITGIDKITGVKLSPCIGELTFDWANSGKGLKD